MTEPHANNVLHFAIHADDVERARRFYEETFGWQFEDWGPPDFYRIRTGTPDSPGIAGALEKRHSELEGGAITGFTCTISVEDIDACKRSIKAHGGKITYSGAIPSVGKILSFEDTERNIVSAMEYEQGALDRMDKPA